MMVNVKAVKSKEKDFGMKNVYINDKIRITATGKRGTGKTQILVALKKEMEKQGYKVECCNFDVHTIIITPKGS